jgi:hypothetical protein
MLFPLQISFINEIANLCEKVGCDVHDVARALGMVVVSGQSFCTPVRIWWFVLSEGHRRLDDWPAVFVPHRSLTP